MGLEEVFGILQTGGPVGMAAIFAWMWWLERGERKEAQSALLVQSNATIQALTKFEAVLERFEEKLQ